MLKPLCFVRVVLLRVVNVESCACKGTVEAFMCWPLCIGGEVNEVQTYEIELV